LPERVPQFLAGLLCLLIGPDSSPINDLVVCSNARRQGVGSALLNAAKGWAVERGLPGISVETQSNNVGACMLYAKAGLVLAGFDTHLYCLSERFKHEVALFWYWHRERDVG
jgi:streptothricin acetyltransferase